MNALPKSNVLFTRPLTNDLKNKVREHQIEIDDKTFIETQYNSSRAIATLHREHFTHWIFTSKEAVNALLKDGDLPYAPQKVYAIGGGTALMLKEYGLHPVVPEKAYASYLTKILEIDNTFARYAFFCGNLRRDTISNFFADQKIPLTEFKIYKTHLIQPEIDSSKYQAVCFCSPSAVESFFSKYKLNNNQICFAIGDMTKNALLDIIEENRIITAKVPSIEGVVESCINHLK